MRLLGVPLVLCAACDPARGDWVGHCDWTGGGGVRHEQDLRLDLGSSDSAGIGAGTGRAIEAGEGRSGEILYEMTDTDFSLDLYLPQGDLVLLRGKLGAD